jgi:hypothetical protein
MRSQIDHPGVGRATGIGNKEGRVTGADATLSNEQANAAEEIKLLLAASDTAARESTDKALDAGQRLLAAKAEAAHGTWLPFLERAGIQERKAQRLMKVAKSGLKSVAVSDLGGITGALKFLKLRENSWAVQDASLKHVGTDMRLAYGLWLEHQKLEEQMVDLFPEEMRDALNIYCPEDEFFRVIERLRKSIMEPESDPVAEAVFSRPEPSEQAELAA